MTDLENTFGAEFAENIEKKIQERRQERERISEDTARVISHLAINEGQFEDGDPMFEYTSDEGISHDVLLMTLAEPREGSVWNQVNQFDNGGMSIPLDYLGEWIWSIFNDESMAKQMEEGEWYIVVGELDTWEPDEGDPQEQLSPVRGVIPLDKAEQYADEYLDGEGFGEDDGLSDFADEEEEESEEDEEEESEDDSSGGGIFGGGGDDEEEEDEEDSDEPSIDATYSEVASVVEELGDQEPDVWDADPSVDEWDTLVMVVCDRLELDPDDDQVASEISDLIQDRIERKNEDEDEEEDDEEEGLF